MTAIYRQRGEHLTRATRYHRPDGRVEDVLLIPSLTRSTVFLYGLNRQDRTVEFGTGFVLSEPVPGEPRSRWVYLTTARHVIEKIRRISEDGYVHIRANGADGLAFWDAVPLSAWFFHPDDDPNLVGDEWLEPSEGPRYDVAATACPHPVVDGSDVVVIPTETSLLTDAEIAEHRPGPGDDVAITGMYHNYTGSDRNIPIVRSAMIAALPHPDEPVTTGLGPMSGAYLIETRSTGGLSGSPVFWISGHQRVAADGTLYELPVSLYRLMGLVQGHYDYDVTTEREPLNEGIAIVTPLRHILDTIRRDDLMAANREIERKQREAGRRGVSRASMDSVKRADDDLGRVSLNGLEAEAALRALLKTPPHAQTEDPA